MGALSLFLLSALLIFPISSLCVTYPSLTISFTGKKLGFTVGSGGFLNISLGQGQEMSRGNTQKGFQMWPLCSFPNACPTATLADAAPVSSVDSCYQGSTSLPKDTSTANGLFPALSKLTTHGLHKNNGKQSCPAVAAQSVMQQWIRAVEYQKNPENVFNFLLMLSPAPALFALFHRLGRAWKPLSHETVSCSTLLSYTRLLFMPGTCCKKVAETLQDGKANTHKIFMVESKCAERKAR